MAIICVSQSEPPDESVSIVTCLACFITIYSISHFDGLHYGLESQRCKHMLRFVSLELIHSFSTA